MKLSRASSSFPFVVRSVPMSDSLEVPEAVSEVSPESFDDTSPIARCSHRHSHLLMRG